MLLGVPGHALDFGDLREQASRPEVLLIPRFLPAQSIDNAETRFEVCFDSLPSATSPQPFSRGDPIGDALVSVWLTPKPIRSIQLDQRSGYRNRHEKLQLGETISLVNPVLGISCFP